MDKMSTIVFTHLYWTEKTREPKPKIIRQQCVVYLFKSGLCDINYVGYTNWHLHQHVAEHSSLNSSIGKHMRDTHGMSKPNLINNFSVLKKCWKKFDCLIHEMLIIQDLKPTLNVQIFKPVWFLVSFDPDSGKKSETKEI